MFCEEVHQGMISFCAPGLHSQLVLIVHCRIIPLLLVGAIALSHNMLSPDTVLFISAHAIETLVIGPHSLDHVWRANREPGSSWPLRGSHVPSTQPKIIGEAARFCFIGHQGSAVAAMSRDLSRCLQVSAALFVAKESALTRAWPHRYKVGPIYPCSGSENRAHLMARRPDSHVSSGKQILPGAHKILV